MQVLKQVQVAQLKKYRNRSKPQRNHDRIQQADLFDQRRICAVVEAQRLKRTRKAVVEVKGHQQHRALKRHPRAARMNEGSSA